MAKQPPSEITARTVLIRRDDVLETEIDGEVVMMSIENSEYYSLGPIGSEIWAMLSAPRSAAEICNVLVELYDVEPEECERDVLAFLRTLLTDGTVALIPSS